MSRRSATTSGGDYCRRPLARQAGTAATTRRRCASLVRSRRHRPSASRWQRSPSTCARHAARPRRRRRCGCEWRRRSTRPTRGSRRSGACEMSSRASSAAPAPRSTTAPAAPPTSPAAAPRRRRGRRSSTSPTAKAPGTPCGRPRSAVRCCPGKTRSTRGRYQRSHGTSSCARARFLAECGWGREQALLSSFERRDRQLLDALRDDLQVVLWFEHDLYDQLQLLDVLALAHTEAGAPELIVVGSFPGRPSFAGLGELTASELETLWPSRGRATPAVLEAATSAWTALRAPEPTTLAEWATRDTAELPFLAPALRRLLEELPAPADGLSGTERRALHAVAAGAHSPPAAFVAAQRLEEAPFLGDAWFYRALSAIGQGKTRLLETGDGAPLPPPPPLSDSQHFARLQLRLTATGEHTLRGEADRVELLGIDRWIGGTHITSDNTWRWDTTALKIVRSSRR